MFFLCEVNSDLQASSALNCLNGVLLCRLSRAYSDLGLCLINDGHHGYLSSDNINNQEKSFTNDCINLRFSLYSPHIPTRLEMEKRFPYETPDVEPPYPQQRPAIMPSSRTRWLLVLLIPIMVPIYLVTQYVGLVNMRRFHPNAHTSGLVPLEAHIMSKCPDARDCLRDLVVPAMEKIYDKADFRLSFIGS